MMLLFIRAKHAWKQLKAIYRMMQILPQSVVGKKMFVYFDKTDFMIQATRQRLHKSHQIKLNLDKSQIKQICTQKFLGIHIDDKLT